MGPNKKTRQFHMPFLCFILKENRLMDKIIYRVIYISPLSKPLSGGQCLLTHLTILRRQPA